ncbi:heme-binding beta-barrel domain-containing protein [Aliikangiella maris]|uniref:Heme-binding beta-barrel domain-containing protein n=2 Tax=Aliikangiella maris TaxID=3162458 RepID=A0ABV2BWZ8_9GAMM
MSNYPNIDYGPLSCLIGQWQGDKGVDVAPEEDGTDTNAYYETIHFEQARDLDNAEEQELVAVHYHQKVFRKRDDKMIHNQTGYWIWDKATQSVIHNFVIPRGMGVLAHGNYQVTTESANENINESTKLTVTANINDEYYGFTQSPFLMTKAKTLSFTQELNVNENQLTYQQTTLVDIYGREFEHTDTNQLSRV